MQEIGIMRLGVQAVWRCEVEAPPESRTIQVPAAISTTTVQDSAGFRVFRLWT